MEEEQTIARDKVLPYIVNEIKWPTRLISEYGRVPVQTGTSVKWADIVCFATRQNRPNPYLLVEVKRKKDDLAQSVPQAESYALMLGCPFFCVTDGTIFDFFLKGTSQGDNIRLQGPIPLPTSENLSSDLACFPFPLELDPLIDLFFQALKSEPRFLSDTKWHSECLKFWNHNIFGRLNDVTKTELKAGVEQHMMPGRQPVKQAVLSTIDSDFDRVKVLLKFLKDWDGDPLDNLNSLLDPNGSRHIGMFGPFIITQLLAGAHPERYIILQDNIARALRDLGMSDIAVKTDVDNGYLYANEICKRIFKDKIKSRLENASLGLASGCELAAVTNFLWHWYDNYRNGKAWGD